MAHVIRQLESAPEEYPAAPSGLSADAAALDPAIVWRRIESYTAYRWTARTVAWIVQGPGEWHPPLTPATIDAAAIQVWNGTAWELIDDLAPSPLGGYFLPGRGPYEFAATVGDIDLDDFPVPPIVMQAYKRLAEYFVADPGTAGARSQQMTVGGLTMEHSRSESWMAMAMQNSGAGDLLRSYRRAA
jgi:hypothetical protein